MKDAGNGEPQNVTDSSKEREGGNSMANAKGRPGFMIYFGDWKAPLKLLSADEFKELFEALFSFSQDGEIRDTFSTEAVSIYYDVLKDKLLIDAEKYNDVCEKRRQAAMRSHAGNNKPMQVQQMQANAANTNPNTNMNTNTNINTNTNQIPTPIQKEYEYNPNMEYEPQYGMQANAANTNYPGVTTVVTQAQYRPQPSQEQARPQGIPDNLPF